MVGKAATEEARGRLAVLEQTSDGFAIAEKDLEARGPGDLLGRRQSGLPALRVADPLHDLGRLAQARGEVLAMRAEGKKVESDLFGYP
jgi:ATP-dependent DNA helicase RecG